MSIATQIERLKNAKESLKAKLIAKGVTISDDATLEQYADFVDEIETGITPTGQLEVTANGNYDVTNYAKANVNVPIPDGYIKPSGSLQITTNGNFDVTEKENAVVNVQPKLEQKTATPTKSQQEITPSSSYDGLSKVIINAIPNKYIVPSGTKSITSNGTNDVTSYASVNVNVQPSLEQKTVTPTTSQQQVTPSTNYYGLSKVTVNAIPSSYIIPSGTKSITSNGTSDVRSYASVNVNVTPKLQSKTVTSNGTVTPDSGYDGLSKVTVNVASSSGSTLKTLLDATKSTYYLFRNYSGSTISNLIAYDDTENVTNMSYMCYGCTSLKTLPLLNCNNTTNMSYMCNGCTSLQTVLLSNTSVVTDMGSAFFGCSSLKLAKINTDNAEIISYMFRLCYVLETVDITRYNCTAFNAGFWCADCYSLKTIIIRSFGSRYALPANAFNNCYHLTGTTNSTYNPNGDKDCYIYVPSSIVSTLKNATNWSVHASQIRALENFTVDGTVNGDLDPDKVASGGSGGGTTGGYTVAINISNTTNADMTGLSYSLDNGTSYTKLPTSTTVQNVTQIMFKISTTGGMNTNIAVGSNTYILGMSSGRTTPNITISSNQTINITYGISGGGYD